MATSARAANEELAKLIAEIDAGHHAGTALLTVAEAIDKALVNLRPRWGAKWSRRVDQLMADVTELVGTMKLRDLKPIDVDHIYTALHNRGLSAKSVRLTHATLRQVLDVCVRWGWIASNPTPGKKEAPRAERSDPTPPSPAQVASLIAVASATDASWVAFIRLARHTGARLGELCAITRSTLDLEGATPTLRIWRTIAEDDAGDEVLRPYPKTKAAVRRISLGPGAVVDLRAHLERQEQLAIDAGVTLSADPFVFSLDPSGTDHWLPSRVTYRWARLADKADLGHVRFHDLRHYMITQALSKGADVYHVAGRAGHANPSVTLNTNAHWIPARDAEVAAALEED